LRGLPLRVAATASISSVVHRDSREVLTQQAVGVLIRPALPRAVRISEIDADSGVDLQWCVLGEFLAAVPGQRTAQLLGQAGHLLGERVAHRLGTVAGQRGPVLPCGVPEVGPGSLTSGDRWSDMIAACRCGCCT
jgi:hypothetical protein